MQGEGKLAREQDHHDRWAAAIDVDSIRVETAFEAVTAPENRFLLRHMGELRGARLLELGSGAGEGSVYFALKGARCTATDCSAGMLAVAERLAARYGVGIETRLADAEHLDFPANSFDLVYAANVLHHARPERVLAEMHRVLRPGGRACFWDPLKHNPLIKVYRLLATEVRSADERPLDIAILREVRERFRTVEHETFWSFTLWIFLRFFLVERVSPNQERYWKKILTDEARLRPAYSRLERLDHLVKRLPFIERYAWNLAVVATK